MDSNSRLVGLLYLLLRDHLTAGHVEEMVTSVSSEQGPPYQFTNGWLAQYAIDLAARINGEATLVSRLERLIEQTQADINSTQLGDRWLEGKLVGLELVYELLHKD